MKLFQNAAFNMVGGILPAIASLLTVPVIVSRLGTDQYGVYALVTSIVGYFAVMDINVTAGSVKYLAEHHARQDHDRASQVFSFGALIYLLIGLAGALGLVVFAHPLVSVVFKVPVAVHDTSVAALRGAAPGFLLGQMQVYLLSVPQALQRYDVAGRFEGVFGALVSVLTVTVVLLGGGLPEIMWARAALSLVNCAALLFAIRAIYPKMRWCRPGRAVMQGVASFSAYSYLSRLATITFLHADNLLIGAMVGTTAVAMFTVPFQLANRVFGIINRASAVLFPASSALAAQGRWEALREAYLNATRYVVYLNGCVLVMLVLGARELLHYWAGPAFDTTATLILILLALSVFMDSLTNIPSLVNDGLGAPRNTGVFAIVRAALGLGGGYFAIQWGGIVGAAMAQLAISVVLTVAFVVVIHRLHRQTLGVSVRCLLRRSWLPSMVLPLGLTVLALAWRTRDPMPWPWFLGTLTLCGLGCLAWGWWHIVLPQDRVRVLAWWAAWRVRMKEA